MEACGFPHASALEVFMAPSLRYVIEFVADMDLAVSFYRDTLGLPVRFESPEWSEIVTGQTTLALHPSSSANPPGTFQLGLTVSDLPSTCSELANRGVRFTRPPARAEFGGMLAEFLDSDGARCSLAEGEAAP
jgi:predicted enzyme related to lactoylglutathione lyase